MAYGWSRRLTLCPEVAPCNGCADRAGGCHAACERYAEYKALCVQRRKERSYRRDANSAAVDAVRRMHGKRSV